MKIGADLCAFIDSGELLNIIENNENLKNFVNGELSRMKDSGVVENCIGGCCGNPSCCKKDENVDISYLTTALMAIFNYYIPEDLKNSIHFMGNTFVE